MSNEYSSAIKVELVSHTPQPDKIIAAAAKLCYSPVGATDIMEGLTPEKVESFLQRLDGLGHESPVEHASFTFSVEGVSRTLLAQLTRHRIATFSVQSQRYVRRDSFVFVTPPQIAELAPAAELFVKAMNDAWESYEQLTALLYDKHYANLIAQGVDEKTARTKAEKTAIEDARYVLPNASETKLIMTMNVRSLRNFFRLRCCNRAQWEIRDLAWQMLKLCQGVSPVLFAKSGPSCIAGVCSEGKMTCGMAQQVRERHKNG